MGDLENLKDDGLRTCTKHFIKVNAQTGICPKCKPYLDIHKDLEYEAERNRFIGAASLMAEDRIKLMFRKKKKKRVESEQRRGMDGRPYNYYYFNRFFCDAMTQLVREHGLRG